MFNITYTVDDKKLSESEFIQLTQKVWPGDYNTAHTAEALKKTIT